MSYTDLARSLFTYYEHSDITIIHQQCHHLQINYYNASINMQGIDTYIYSSNNRAELSKKSHGNDIHLLK